MSVITPTDPSVGGYISPPGVSVVDNMALAAGQARPDNALYGFNWFYEKVRNNREGRPDSWDYKQGHPEYEGFGNFNYGAAGTAMGIPESILLAMAGAANVRADPNRITLYGIPFLSESNGDDPDDQEAIRAGIKYAKENGYDEVPPLIDGSSIRTGILPLDIVISKILLNTPDPLVKAIKFVMVDPLVLDLDGDGLEISPLSGGVQFDGNGDTIRTATAWIDADDGLLALDRNGNGVIDSGRELFGDETLLADGKKAAHGFAALVELDVGGAAGASGGAGDGLFDAKDAQFGAVRIWRDANQDGISQAGELQTLAQAGIASVQLTSTKTDTSYGDAQLVQSGSFTRDDGSEGQAGSFILAQNNAVATHAPIAISAAAAALPAIQGSGWVRGLQEAATLKPQLLDLFGGVQGAGSRAGFGAVTNKTIAFCYRKKSCMHFLNGRYSPKRKFTGSQCPDSFES